MMKTLWLLAGIFLFESGQALAQEKPPLPHYDWGACPFECCTYREWKANQDVVAYSDHKNGASVAFTIQKGEWVAAETGVVITTKAGITKVLKPFKLGYQEGQNVPSIDAKPGDILYTLHYAGEGFDLFWFKGKKYTDQIASNKPTPVPPPPEFNVQVISRPEADWWVRVKNKKGQTGWIKNPPYFENADACA